MRAIAARFLGVVVLGLAACAITTGCGDDFRYEGTPGQPIAASFDAWVPAVGIVLPHPEPAIAGKVIVDTGAPFTIVDRDRFELDDGKHRTDLYALDLRFPDYPIIAYDVFDQASVGYDGLIGGDLLRHFALTLDYRDERLWLRDADTSALPNGVSADTVEATHSVAVDIAGGGRALVPGQCPGGCGTTDVAATRVLVEVTLENRAAPVWFLVDTGASATVLPETLLAELGDGGRPRLDGVSVATVNGLLPAYFTRVSSISVGSAPAATRTSQPVLVIPGWDLFSGLELETGVPVRGVIGGSFLRHFLTTVDYRQRQLHLARYVDQSHVDTDEFVRVGFTLVQRDGEWQVADVYADTDAAAEGLLSGDVIVDLDGTPVTGLDEAEVGGLLAGYAVGEEVPVGLRRGATTFTVEVMVEDLLPAYE